MPKSWFPRAELNALGLSEPAIRALEKVAEAGEDQADLGLIAAMLFSRLASITAAGNAVVTPEHIGFGFEAAGNFADNEFLGFASWPINVKFTGASSDSYLNAFPGSVATADAVFTITDLAFTTLGTVTVPAGTRFGALAWTVDPYTHPADDFLLLFAPTPADATLGNVNALIVGAAA